MTSLNTVFKRIYAEALAPYGFKKIKGRQPYFVRLAGNEIIHVITVAPSFSSKQFHRCYEVYAGVATVYRPRINMEKTPRSSFIWLINNLLIYKHTHFFSYTPDEADTYRFYYKSDNEESLIKSVKESVPITERVILPELNKVTDLNSCIDFLKEYNSGALYIDDSEGFGKENENNESNEALINFIAFDTDEYIEQEKCNLKKLIEKEEYFINQGLFSADYAGEPFENFKRKHKEFMLEQIAVFKKYKDNPKEYEKVLKEMECRKKANQEILRAYGFEI